MGDVISVVSLELAKKLKELGFPQDGGGWYWELPTKKLTLLNREDANIIIAMEMNGINYPIRVIKAPTSVELMNVVPSTIRDKDGCEYSFMLSKIDDEYVPSYFKEPVMACDGMVELHIGEPCFDVNLPNAIAKLLIWLIENDYVNFGKEDTKHERGTL